MLGQCQTHHGLRHHGGSRDCGAVRALIDGLGGLSGGDVHGAQGARYGGNRFHGRAHPNRLPVGHTALDAAGTIRQACNAAIIAWHHLIMCHGTGAASLQESIADLHTLDCLDANDRGGQGGVQPTIRFHVRADACRHTVCDDFNHTTQRVGLRLGLIDAGHHALLSVLVQCAHRRGIEGRHVIRARQRRVVTLHTGTANRDHMAHGSNARHLLQEQRGHFAERHARCRLAGAGPFEHRTSIVETVFAPSRASSWSSGSALITSVHFGHSVLPISMAIGDPNVLPNRTPVSRRT